MRRYTVVLIPDLNDGGYTVQVPALPGCITEGDTVDEAIENAREAIQLYLDDMIANGERLPEDTGAPILKTVEV
jgi:antitoxin HicB